MSNENPHPGLSRRNFLKTLGLGAAAAATLPAASLRSARLIAHE